jgi:hypothetical protein
MKSPRPRELSDARRSGYDDYFVRADTHHAAATDNRGYAGKRKRFRYKHFRYENP